jgi:hypothetical protein
MTELSKSFTIQVPPQIVYEFIRSTDGKAGQIISDFPSFGLKVMADTLIEDVPGVKLIYETRAYGAAVLREYYLSPAGSGTTVILRMLSSGMSYSKNELKMMFYPYVLELISMEWGVEKGINTGRRIESSPSYPYSEA